MSREQQAARINISDDEWIDFRTLAMRKHRSIADYLAELVRRELGGAKQPSRGRAPERTEPPSRQPARSVRLADQDLLTKFPHRRSQPPSCEE